MSKKLLILIMSVVIGLVLLGGGLFAYFTTKNDTDGATISETLQKLNPFGSSDPLGVRYLLDTNPSENTASTSTKTGEDFKPTQVLFKLSDERSSGIGFADVLIPRTVERRKRITIDDPLVTGGSKPRKIQVMATTTETVYATSSRIRYVEQGSGHIYEYDYASSSSRKLTNTTIPKTQEAYFLDNGSKVLLRYLDTSNRVVENYLANIPTSSVADKLTGEFLPSNITSVSVSPTTNEFLYIAKTGSGSLGNVYSTRSGTEKRVFSSAFSEWLPEWTSAGVFMTTKPASTFQGFTYLQSLTRNTFTRIIGNKLGLTILPNPEGTKILTSEGLNMSVLDISTGNLIPIRGIYTLPEKCIWHKNDSNIICFADNSEIRNNYPEVWYQGKTYFSDALYSISPETGDSYLLATMSEMFNNDVSIDAIKLSLSKDQKSLIFINKIDMSPWYISLEKALELYQAL